MWIYLSPGVYDPLENSPVITAVKAQIERKRPAKHTYTLNQVRANATFHGSR
jgi:hypothetical protein